MKRKVIDKRHFYVSDSGVTFEVVDEGYGPTVTISSFGNLEHQFKVMLDRKCLLELGKMFTSASNEFYSKDYCNKAEYFDNKKRESDSSSVQINVLEPNKFVMTDDIRKQIILELVKTKQGWKKLFISLKNSNVPEKAKLECFKMFDLIFSGSEITEMCKEKLNKMFNES